MRTLGWRKIYLAYGMIFFSLGLIGRISQPILWRQFRAKAGQLWRNIQIYTDLPMSFPGEIPVFQEIWGGRQIYFFYPNYLSKTQMEVWQEIQEMFSEYSYSRELILYPLSEKDMIGRLLTVKAPSSAILIGLQLNSQSRGMQVELNFNLPEERLQQTLTEFGQLPFNPVQVRKFRQKLQVIYQLRWISEEYRLVADLRQVLRQLLNRGGNQI